MYWAARGMLLTPSNPRETRVSSAESGREVSSYPSRSARGNRGLPVVSHKVTADPVASQHNPLHLIRRLRLRKHADALDRSRLVQVRGNVGPSLPSVPPSSHRL